MANAYKYDDGALHFQHAAASAGFDVVVRALVTGGAKLIANLYVDPALLLLRLCYLAVSISCCRLRGVIVMVVVVVAMVVVSVVSAGKTAADVASTPGVRAELAKIT
jgi:hypothetical protein